MKSVEAKNGKEVAAKKTTPFLINVIAQRRERERKKAGSRDWGLLVYCLMGKKRSDIWTSSSKKAGLHSKREG